MNSLGWVYWQKIMLRISNNPKDDIQQGLMLADKALSIRQTHAPALSLELSLLLTRRAQQTPMPFQPARL